jgi:hypothetical protein
VTLARDFIDVSDVALQVGQLDFSPGWNPTCFLVDHDHRITSCFPITYSSAAPECVVWVVTFAVKVRFRADPRSAHSPQRFINNGSKVGWTYVLNDVTFHCVGRALEFFRCSSSHLSWMIHAIMSTRKAKKGSNLMPSTRSPSPAPNAAPSSTPFISPRFARLLNLFNGPYRTRQ